MIILLVGSPGSGKGTQARFISERLAIPTISTGDMLRAECEAETVLGLAAQSILAAGKLVDDELVNAMVVNRLSRPDCGDGLGVEDEVGAEAGDLGADAGGDLADAQLRTRGSRGHGGSFSARDGRVETGAAPLRDRVRCIPA